MSQCDAFGLLPDEAADQILQVITVVNEWKLYFSQTGVTPKDIDSLAQQIDGAYLLNQRMHFDASKFKNLPTKKIRSSPFKTK